MTLVGAISLLTTMLGRIQEATIDELRESNPEDASIGISYRFYLGEKQWLERRIGAIENPVLLYLHS